MHKAVNSVRLKFSFNGLCRKKLYQNYDSSMYEDFFLIIGLYVSFSNSQQFYFEKRTSRKTRKQIRLVKL